MLEQITERLRSWLQPLSLSPASKVPRGKLGLVLMELQEKDRVSLRYLMTLTGWQKHTVRAALSRLRGLGFIIRQKRINDETVYHLDRRRK